MLIAQISDLHVKEPGQLSFKRIDTNGFAERALAQLIALRPRPDVVLVTGDLVDIGVAKEYAHLRLMLQSLDLPFYIIPGNHDDRGLMRQTFSDHDYLPE